MINEVGKLSVTYGETKSVQKNNPFTHNPYNTHYLDFNEKISFKEGAKLFAKGFGKQIKNMAKGIVEHPLRTAATVALTSGALLALPLVGIPTAVGGAVMAIGFGAVGAAKMIGNTAKGIKHNRNGNGQLAKYCFEKAGSAGVDVALSAPFIPKGIKTIKDFTKYGKIGVNSTLLSEFKSVKGIKNKIKTLKNANTEFNRNYDYQKLVDKKLQELNIPKDKIDIYRKELLEFNVPVDDIPQVVMRKVVKSKGYDLEIPVHRDATRKNDLGFYSFKTGEVTLKDFSKPDLAPGRRKGKYIIGQKAINDSTYMATIKDAETGALSYETVSKRVLDNYYDLRLKSKSVSARGDEILTIVHELEHWWQHGQINKLNGQVPSCATPKGKAMYTKMLQQQPVLKTGEYANAVKYANANANYAQTLLSPVKYLENELEVGARAAEAKMLNSPEFSRH